MQKNEITDTNKMGRTTVYLFHFKVLYTNEPFRARHVSAGRCLFTLSVSSKPRNFVFYEIEETSIMISIRSSPMEFHLLGKSWVSPL